MGFLFRQFFKLIAMAVTITSTVDPIYFTRNPIEVELHTDETWASTLRIICEVKVELVYDSSTYVLIATHSSTPDSATNKSKFRLDKILDSAFYEALEFPDYNGTIPNTAIDGGYSDNHIKRVTIRFADNGGDPFATYDFLVIHGGMSFQKFYEYDWLNQYAVHNRFFTWLGAKKTIPHHRQHQPAGHGQADHGHRVCPPALHRPGQPGVLPARQSEEIGRAHV